MKEEIINSIALTRLNYHNLTGLLQLYRQAGSATAVMEHRHDIRALLPDAQPRLVKALSQMDDAIRRAEAEYQWCLDHQVQPLAYSDDAYPQRLRECSDAPLVLFYRGKAPLNRAHVVSIVGTRNATQYGDDLLRRFMQQLRDLCPDILVVSGLAYGIDIMAHRYALRNDLETVGVLAHGLDDLYPSAHRETASQMIGRGGLLTEFLSGTRPDKVNFVRRNRIVAGVADATILVESAAKGGGLITTSIARSYNREVFAFPGAVGATYSEGCNQLIRDNGAQLIQSAADFVQSMGWTSDKELQEARQSGIERQLFPDLSPDEQVIVAALRHTNDLQINLLAVKTNLPMARLSAHLFSLEMKGVVKTLAGGVYHLLS